jgi:hypothetical protein
VPVWRLQCSIAADSVFPRDYVVINPHFNDQGPGTNPQNLCQDLANALDTYIGVGSREINVKAYDAQGTPPVIPQGFAQKNKGVAPASNSPREIALCLSFYSEQNTPSRRGRLFFPYFLLGTVSGVRPSTTARTTLSNLVPILTGLGGTDVDWSVYSRKTNQSHPVTNWFIDDEWDVVRSRGLRPTTRTQGTVSE